MGPRGSFDQQAETTLKVLLATAKEMEESEGRVGVVFNFYVRSLENGGCLP